MTNGEITMIFSHEELHAYARSFLDLAKLLAMHVYNSIDENGHFVLASEIVDIESHLDKKSHRIIINEIMIAAKHASVLGDKQIEDALLRACTCIIILMKSTDEAK